MSIGNPTPKQRAAWEATQRLGSQAAAGRELGVTQGNIAASIRRYMEAMGMTGPVPVGHGGGWHKDWHVGLEPTPRQAQAWEAFQRLGSQAAAARELGMSSGSLSARIRGYLERTGVVDPTLDPTLDPAKGRKGISMLTAELAYERTERARLIARCTELEATNAKLAKRAAAADRLEQKIDRILRSVERLQPPNLRRADGGPRHQRKAAAA